MLGYRITQVVYWVGAALYLGGIVALGVVAAPAIFQTVRETGAGMPGMGAWINSSQQLGGEIFGNVLIRFRVLEWLCLAMMGLGMVGGWMWGQQRKLGRWVRVGLLSVLGLLVIYDAVYLTPAVWQARSQWRQASDASHALELQRRFDVLHKQAEGLGHAKMWLLLGLVTVSAWGEVGRRNRQLVRGERLWRGKQ